MMITTGLVDWKSNDGHRREATKFDVFQIFVMLLTADGFGKIGLVQQDNVNICRPISMRFAAFSQGTNHFTKH